MNFKKYLNISVGAIQAFIGLILIILAFLVYQGIYELLGGNKTVSFVILMVLGILSIFSGFALSSK